MSAISGIACWAESECGPLSSLKVPWEQRRKPSQFAFALADHDGFILSEIDNGR